MAENKGTWLDQQNQLKLKQEDKRSSEGKLDIILIADMKILIQAALESMQVAEKPHKYLKWLKGSPCNKAA